jgi:hypothetical protein
VEPAAPYATAAFLAACDPVRLMLCNGTIIISTVATTAYFWIRYQDADHTLRRTKRAGSEDNGAVRILFAARYVESLRFAHLCRGKREVLYQAAEKGWRS